MNVRCRLCDEVFESEDKVDLHYLEAHQPKRYYAGGMPIANATFTPEGSNPASIFDNVKKSPTKQVGSSGTSTQARTGQST